MKPHHISDKSTTTRLGALSISCLLAAAVGLGACSDSVVDSAPPGSMQQPLQCGAAELYVSAHNSCDAMDATGQPDEQGDCQCLMGFKFDGTQCVTVGNCQCVGADCNKLTETLHECEAAHADCFTPPSGSGLACGDPLLFSQPHDVCDPMDATGVPDEQGDCLCLIGFAWDGDECVSVTNCRCEGEDCDKLSETPEECEAAHAGCGSTSAGLSCGDVQLYSLVHDECSAMDAVAAGDEYGHCLCMLGYAWDGNECVMLGDCQCLGEDCDKLTETLEECEAAHAGC